MMLLLLEAVNVYAEIPNMTVKSWCADDLNIGNTSGYSDLEFMLPVGGTANNGIMVTNEGRRYDAEHDYDSAIKTRGAVNTGLNCVPRGRAMKFTVSQPCDIVVYAYGASSSSNVSLQISREGKIVETFPLVHSRINKYIAYLDVAGTYYVYSTGGSMGVCEMQVGYIKGDLDIDFEVTWNDMRLLRKNIVENDSSFIVNHKFDVNQDGIYSASDLSELLMIAINSGTEDYMNFVSYTNWNANEMSLGCYEIYNGLELVPKEGDIANGSVNVISLNKSYVEPSGEVRNYTKCISLNGKMADGFGPYPVSRAIKFNLAEAKEVVIYMRCDSSVKTQHKAQIINGDGDIVKELDVDGNVKRYVVKLDGNETYFLGGVYGKLEVFEIDINNCTAESDVSFTKSLSVTANQSCELNLVAVNSFYQDRTIYKFTYDPNMLSLKSIGNESEIVLNKLLPNGIMILSTEPGSITFSVPGRKSFESGILTNVEFTAQKTGNTSVKLEGILNYD